MNVVAFDTLIRSRYHTPRHAWIRLITSIRRSHDEESMMSYRIVGFIRQSLLTVCVLAAWSLASTASAQTPAGPWPQFRGPNGSGVAEGQKPPVEFGPDKNVKWKVKAPGGLSSPIVAGDKLVITAFEDGKLITVAYDRASGKEAWRAEAPA